MIAPAAQASSWPSIPAGKLAPPGAGVRLLSAMQNVQTAKASRIDPGMLFGHISEIINTY